MSAEVRQTVYSQYDEVRTQLDRCDVDAADSAEYARWRSAVRQLESARRRFDDDVEELNGAVRARMCEVRDRCGSTASREYARAVEELRASAERQLCECELTFRRSLERPRCFVADVLTAAGGIVNGAVKGVVGAVAGRSSTPVCGRSSRRHLSRCSE